MGFLPKAHTEFPHPLYIVQIGKTAHKNGPPQSPYGIESESLSALNPTCYLHLNYFKTKKRKQPVEIMELTFKKKKSMQN